MASFHSKQEFQYLIVIEKYKGSDTLLEQVPRLDMGFHLDIWLAKLLAYWIHRQMVVELKVSSYPSLCWFFVRGGGDTL